MSVLSQTKKAKLREKRLATVARIRQFEQQRGTQPEPLTPAATLYDGPGLNVPFRAGRLPASAYPESMWGALSLRERQEALLAKLEERWQKIGSFCDKEHCRLEPRCAHHHTPIFAHHTAVTEMHVRHASASSTRLCRPQAHPQVGRHRLHTACFLPSQHQGMWRRSWLMVWCGIRVHSGKHQIKSNQRKVILSSAREGEMDGEGERARASVLLSPTSTSSVTLLPRDGCWLSSKALPRLDLRELLDGGMGVSEAPELARARPSLGVVLVMDTMLMLLILPVQKMCK